MPPRDKSKDGTAKYPLQKSNKSKPIELESMSLTEAKSILGYDEDDGSLDEGVYPSPEELTPVSIPDQLIKKAIDNLNRKEDTLPITVLSPEERLRKDLINFITTQLDTLSVDELLTLTKEYRYKEEDNE